MYQYLFQASLNLKAMSSTTTIPLFDHLPGEQSNKISLNQIKAKDAYYETDQKIRILNNLNETIRNLSASAKFMIILAGISFFVFAIGDAAFSWEVFKDKVSSMGNSDTINTIVTIVIVAFACVAIIGSNMMKQPWTKNIPGLDFNGKSKETLKNYSGRAQSLSRYKPKNSDSSAWTWFIIGLLLTVSTGYVLYMMSVEREQFSTSFQEYSETNSSNDVLEALNLDFSLAGSELESEASQKTLPISVWLPLLFYAAEVATGWALIPMFLLFAYWIKAKRLVRQKESYKERGTQLFDEIVTVYPAYNQDIQDYNSKFSQNEQTLTPNPELREVLHIYNQGGHSLTRINRKDKVKDIDPLTSDVEDTEQLIDVDSQNQQNENNSNTQNNDSDFEETLTSDNETDFFDTESII